MGRQSTPLLLLFLAKVRREGECSVWTAFRNSAGYGRFTYREGGKVRQMLAHRMAYQLAYGPIPGGLFVCHRCDNPPCVRPDHLFLGTAHENSHDSQTKGRSARGRKQPAAKLTEADVRSIRALYAGGGLTQSEIGRRFGVSPVNVCRIVNGTRWQYVD